MVELWAGMGVLFVATIIGIISYFAKNMVRSFENAIGTINTNIEKIDVKMDNLYIHNSRNDKDIEKIKDDVQDIYTEIDKTNNKIDDLHTKVTILETQHLRNHK
jgi:peptidoglycan hydrolase CwlO-like protein